MATLNKKETALLEKIATATAENTFVYMTEKAIKTLVKAELVECNPNDLDENGKIATRATSEGLALVMKPVDASEGETTPEAVSSDEFELESGIAIPVARRGRSGSTRYPFDRMEVDQSFHVAATEENPNPAKKIASSVSSAIKRYRDAEGNKTWGFVVRRVDATDPTGPGARVFRTE